MRRPPILRASRNRVYAFSKKDAFLDANDLFFGVLFLDGTVFESVHHSTNRPAFFERRTFLKMEIVGELFKDGSNFTMRKTARQLSYRLRYRAMSSNDQVQARSLRKILFLLIILRKRSEKLDELFKIVTMLYISKVIEQSSDWEPLERPVKLHISVGSFTDTNCKNFFRFNKEH
jgi:hypothetical protein